MKQLSAFILTEEQKHGSQGHLQREHNFEDDIERCVDRSVVKDLVEGDHVRDHKMHQPGHQQGEEIDEKIPGFLMVRLWPVACSLRLSLVFAFSGIPPNSRLLLVWSLALFQLVLHWGPLLSLWMDVVLLAIEWLILLLFVMLLLLVLDRLDLLVWELSLFIFILTACTSKRVSPGRFAVHGYISPACLRTAALFVTVMLLLLLLMLV